MVLNTDLKVNVENKIGEKYDEAIVHNIANYLGASEYVYSIPNLVLLGNHDGPCT